MSKILNILIVDDHAIIIESYRSVLQRISENESRYQFRVHTAQDCDSASILIDKLADTTMVDLALLDIRIPPSKNGRYTAGDDIGVKLKEIYPQVKVIVLTTHTENFRLFSILNKLNPEALLLKSELTSAMLEETIKDVLDDIPRYSRPVLQLMRKHITNHDNVDATDRKLIYQLSMGTKTKDLPEYLNLSLPGIERRKRLLKSIFNIEGMSDKALIKVAREKGFL